MAEQARSTPETNRFILSLPADSPSVALGAIRAVAGSFGGQIEEQPLPPVEKGVEIVEDEAALYFKAYTTLTEEIRRAPTHCGNGNFPRSRPYSKRQRRQFEALGYRSIIRMVSMDCKTRMTVIEHESVNALTPQFTITEDRHMTSGKQAPPYRQHKYLIGAEGATVTSRDWARNWRLALQLEPIRTQHIRTPGSEEILKLADDVQYALQIFGTHWSRDDEELQRREKRGDGAAWQLPATS